MAYGLLNVRWLSDDMTLNYCFLFLSSFSSFYDGVCCLIVTIEKRWRTRKLDDSTQFSTNCFVCVLYIVLWSDFNNVSIKVHLSCELSAWLAISLGVMKKLQDTCLLENAIIFVLGCVVINVCLNIFTVFYCLIISSISHC